MKLEVLILRSFFEELKQIAEEEFGCTIINSSDSKTFEEIFGFGMSDINENAEIFLKEQISIENCGYKFHTFESIYTKEAFALKNNSCERMALAA